MYQGKHSRRQVVAMGPQQQAVDEVREFSRFFTRVLGVLDYAGRLESTFTLAEARVLYELARRERATVADLRGDLGLSAAYFSRMLSRFDQDGLVVRSAHDVDARYQQVALTDAGRAEAARLDGRAREAVTALLADLSPARLGELTTSLRTARALLSEAAGGADKPTVRLREPEPGDMGWVISRNGALYAREFGFDASYEALVARIVGEYAADHDPARERGWIAELEQPDGTRRPVGAVFCVRDTAPETARLRLLLVEPDARGLGIGEQLVSACVDFARTTGYRELVLWTQSTLTSARRIYRRAGFEPYAETRHHSFGQDLTGEDWRLIL
jgi:DNA-binding MarR family transcriptional regulator/GNAT superfamily N-acetyltransferase